MLLVSTHHTFYPLRSLIFWSNQCLIFNSKFETAFFKSLLGYLFYHTTKSKC